MSIKAAEAGGLLRADRPLTPAAALDEAHGALLQEPDDALEIGPVGLAERRQQLLLDRVGEGGDLEADRRPLGRQLENRAAPILGVGRALQEAGGQHAL